MWDKLASESAGAGEWTEKANNMCEQVVDMRDFLTFAVMNVKHSVKHRPQIKECVAADQEKTGPRQLGPPDNTNAAKKAPRRRCAGIAA